MTDRNTNPFWRRLRSLVGERGLTFGDVSKRAELDASLVSRLAAESDEARRAPRMEHILALAGALDMVPAELVAGTDAAPVLGAWVPREELERELNSRLDAQREAAHARTDSAALRAEIEVVRGHASGAERTATDAAARARKAEVELASARAAAAHAQTERDLALADAQRLSVAWSAMRANLVSARTQLAATEAARARNAGLALVGTLFGGIIGAALAAPDGAASAAPSRRRSRST